MAGITPGHDTRHTYHHGPETMDNTQMFSGSNGFDITADLVVLPIVEHQRIRDINHTVDSGFASDRLLYQTHIETLLGPSICRYIHTPARMNKTDFIADNV